MSEPFYHRLDDSLELRCLEECDAEPLFALTDTNREYLQSWLPWLEEAQSVEDTLRFIRGGLRQFQENHSFNTGIWLDGRLAGVVGFHPIDWANRCTSLGYWLAEEFQGRGIMTRCVEHLVDFGFHMMGLHRIEIRCAAPNTRSRAIPTRLGFLPEGTLRESQWLHDRFADVVLYSMLARDWRKRSQGSQSSQSSQSS